MSKLYCVSKAIPILPINIEDAARSDAEIEKAEQVVLHLTYIAVAMIRIIIAFKLLSLQSSRLTLSVLH